MKVETTEKTAEKYRNFTLKLRDSTCEKLDGIAAKASQGRKNKVSRQGLIEAIVEQALGDPKFVVKLP